MHADLAQDQQAGQLTWGDPAGREQPRDGGCATERGDDGGRPDRAAGACVADGSGGDTGQGGGRRAYEPDGCSTGEMRMSSSMLVAHTAATAVSALLLARGEAFVWQLAERLGLRVTALDLELAPIPSWRPLPPVIATRSLRDIRLAHLRVETGPPSGL